MAATAWKVTGLTTKSFGNGTIDLTTGSFYMGLYSTTAATVLAAMDLEASTALLSTVTPYVVTGGGYVPILLTGISWAESTTTSMAWTFASTGAVFTATGSAIASVRYGVIYKGTTVICYSALDTANFDVTSGQVMTVFPHATGVFTLTKN